MPDPVIPLDQDLWTTVGSIIGFIIAGTLSSLLTYKFANPKPKIMPPSVANSAMNQDPVLMGVGWGLEEKAHMAEFIRYGHEINESLGVIAESLKILADKRQSDMENTMEEIKDAIKKPR